MTVRRASLLLASAICAGLAIAVVIQWTWQARNAFTEWTDSQL